MNRDDFPILSRQVYNRPLVYLDNAATTQKPLCVIEAMTDEYLNVNANVHRGVHFLSQQATELHEASRETVRRFINARSTAEVVFTRGTTESINLVATCLARLLNTSPHPAPACPPIAPACPTTAPSCPTTAPSCPPTTLSGAPATPSCPTTNNNGAHPAPSCLPTVPNGALATPSCLPTAPNGALATTASPLTVPCGSAAGSPEVIVTAMEHHSNIVPWQLAGFRLRVIPIDDEGNLILDDIDSLFNANTRIVSVAHVSNVLGTVNPVERLAEIAHIHNVPILVDGAQSAPHQPIDVQALGCDFFAFSGHKIYGPTGVGVLYGREEWLDRLPPYMGGGDMIKTVTFERTTYNVLPYKFEAGTPDYVATTGLARALDYVSAIGMDKIQAHEQELTQYAMRRMAEIPGMRFIGTPQRKDAVVSFLVGDIHHLDMGTLLDRLGIAVRTGHHCAEPLMRRMGVEGTVRASFALYNTREEVDALCAAIARVQSMF